MEILNKLPKEVGVMFSAFSEPFISPDCAKMILTSHELGHAVGVFTTLVGATLDDIELIKDIPFKVFCLHLPDGKYFIAPKSQTYRETVFKSIQSIRNVFFMSMNDNFKSHVRASSTFYIHFEPKTFNFCRKFAAPQPVVLPNGDVYLCCEDFGLNHKIGNLLLATYTELENEIIAKKGQFELCRYCSLNET